MKKLYCVICGKYRKFEKPMKPWVTPLKDKKGITIANAFQRILNESKRKPNKIWVDKGKEFCNKSMKSWLEKNRNVLNG